MRMCSYTGSSLHIVTLLPYCTVLSPPILLHILPLLPHPSAHSTPNQLPLHPQSTTCPFCYLLYPHSTLHSLNTTEYYLRRISRGFSSTRMEYQHTMHTVQSVGSQCCLCTVAHKSWERCHLEQQKTVLGFQNGKNP